MSSRTTPVFVVGSGRSGTRMMYKLLSGHEHIEIHHEFACTHVQPLAAQYFMGILDGNAIKDAMSELHSSAIYYTDSDYWVDCSNKLSWIIEPLFERHPNARVIHITRDGRKVTSSFFHKLAAEIYDDVSVAILREWLSNRHLPKPPPEKRYWWNIPQPGQPFAEEFSSFDQYRRICYHWRESTRIVQESLSKLPASQTMTVKLEDLIRDKNTLSSVLDMFDVDYAPSYLDFLRTPQNVFFPMDFNLSEEQESAFNEIAGDMMQRLGYFEAKTYTVRY
jgi:hypothetical protein